MTTFTEDFTIHIAIALTNKERTLLISCDGAYIDFIFRLKSSKIDNFKDNM